MKVPVEVQLLRDWKPRSRPTNGFFDWNPQLGMTFAPNLIKLANGSQSDGTENLIVGIRNPQRIAPSWMLLQVTFEIESVPMSEFRPGVLYLGETDTPSCVVHFPVMASQGIYSGFHSVLLRTKANAV